MILVNDSIVAQVDAGKVNDRLKAAN